MTTRFLALVFLICLTGFGPFLILPGGELDGELNPIPADWSMLEAVKTVQLETAPDDPYSVNIWIVGVEGVLYIHAGANRTQWVENIEANPDVRIRVGESLYELTAERVTEAAEFARFSSVYEKKYGRRPRNENVAEAYLFRLTPR